MYVVNVIDIVFYRAFLSKIYLTAGVDYVFAFPEEGAVDLPLTDPAPDAVLLQDSYMSLDSAQCIERIRAAARTAGRGIPILYLLPFDAGDAAGMAAVPEGRDIHPVNRHNLARVLDDIHRRGQTPPQTARRRILFVDAGRTLLHVVRAALSEAGFQVVAAHDAGQALSLCRKHPYELVLTSALLPGGLSGSTCAGGSRRKTRAAICRSSSCRAATIPWTWKTAFGCGADDYLLKSFTPEMLAAKVSEHLDLVERKRHNKILIADDTKLIRRCCATASSRAGTAC